MKSSKKAVRAGRGGHRAERTAGPKAARGERPLADVADGLHKVVKANTEREFAVFRVVFWPSDLWEAVKATAKTKGTASRHVVDEAVQQESADLVAELRALGLDGEKPPRRVRQSLNTGTLLTLRHMSDQTGIPQGRLILMAVQRHTAKRGAK